MTNIVQFPNKEEIFPPIPRHRVFYLGYRYVGGMCCQDVQNIYLKRKGILHGNRYWAIITYDKYNNYCSLELEECHEDDVIEMIDMFDLDSFPSIKTLRSMGWRGKIKNKENLLNNLLNDPYHLSKNCKIIDINKTHNDY
jgi:hypothetical protein